MNYQYRLQPYKGRNTRHECPNCHDKHSFTLYIDADGNSLSPVVGRCDHESGCGYHYPPSDYFKDNPSFGDRPTIPVFIPPLPKEEVEPSYIPYYYVYRSLTFDNFFTRFLTKILDIYTLESPSIERVYSDYLIGSTKDKGTIFWQIDINGKVRTGKKIIFNPDTGHRDKSIPPICLHPSLIKRKLIPEDFHLVQCFFGEHLLRRYPKKKVAIVESEKTAVICSATMPAFIWIATGGIGQFSLSKMQVLEDRDVTIFPDADGFEKWSKQADVLKSVAAKVAVNRIIEDGATAEQKALKIDIADLIIDERLKERQYFSGAHVTRMITHQPTPYEILWEVYDVNFRTLVTELDLIELDPFLLTY